MVNHLPALEDDKVVALRNGDTSTATSISETLSTLGANLQQAAAHMDDVVLEVDLMPARLVLKFRAYKRAAK
jgi:hypothetical protein